MHSEYCFSSEGDVICATGCTHWRDEKEARLSARITALESELAASAKVAVSAAASLGALDGYGVALSGAAGTLVLETLDNLRHDLAAYDAARAKDGAGDGKGER